MAFTLPSTLGFSYRDNQLYIEDVAATAIVSAYDTPTYVYSAMALTENYRHFAGAFKRVRPLVAYAIKANFNLAVVRTLAQAGAGADIVSVGEMAIALAAGIPADKICFAGVGKTRAEMAAALQAGIKQFNVEAIEELSQLNEVAASIGVKAPVSLRVNPDVAADTHHKIATGKKHDKFGIDWERIGEACTTAAALPHLQLVGVSCHIGSQLLTLPPFRAAFERMRDLVLQLRQAGHTITRVDLGGGVGVRYTDQYPLNLADYNALIEDIFADLDVEIIVEPGRQLVANAGVLLSRVVVVKTMGRRFAVLDAAMNDLIRPALYEARHAIVPLRSASTTQLYDVVGPVCESSDLFGRDYALPPLHEGDAVAIMTAGAYGSAMSSEYNVRPLAAEVLVRGNHHAVTRPRRGVDDIIASYTTPPWLE